MSDESDETVWVVAIGGGGGGRNNIHTDPECHHVLRATNVYEKPRHLVDDDRLCQTCSGDWSPAQNSNTNTNALRETLATTAPEDLGLSPLGERLDQDGDQA